MSSEDLEIVPVAGEATAIAAPRRHRHRHRWPWALGGTLAVLVALVFPVRTALAHAEVDRLEREWADLVALDASRDSLVNRLVSESVPTDEAALRQATIALDDEEAHRVAALHASLPTNRLDHGASELRSAIAGAFEQEVAGLRASIASLRRGENFLPSQLYATSIGFGDVQAKIDSQRRRFGEDLHNQHQSSATLHAADAALATFSHFSNVPLGVRLLVTTNFGVRVLDIDRSTDGAVNLGADTKTVVAFGSVYATSRGRVFRLPADLSGSGHDLGPGELVVPAASGQLWIATGDGALRLATPQGQTVWGPQPNTFGLAGSADGGVVVAVPATAGFAVVDPRTGATIRSIVTGSQNPILVSASGDTVAYTQANDIDLHVVTVSSGRQRDFPVLSPGSHQTGVGVISPDGRWLATYEISSAGVATPIVIDLASGAVNRLTNVSNPNPGLSMAWTADSERLFFTVNEDGASVATWQVGDASATVLRWRSATAGSVAVLP